MTRNHPAPTATAPAGIVIPLRLTKRQEKYSARAVGIARAVYNLMVATHQLARNHGHGPWPSPMEMEKLFNELKQGDPQKKGESEPTYQGPLGMAFVTKVSKFVAQGACRDFRSAYNRWRDREIKAAKPAFHKKNAAGTGSFLAASGVDRIKYDGHRRITLPYLGSVKLKRSLPRGILYEATIRKHLGQWELCLGYWNPPEGAEVKTHEAGAADVGIQPLAVDSELTHYENPKPLYQYLKQLGRWPKSRPAGKKEADSKPRTASTPSGTRSWDCAKTSTTRSADCWSGSTRSSASSPSTSPAWTSSDSKPRPSGTPPLLNCSGKSATRPTGTAPS